MQCGILEGILFGPSIRRQHLHKSFLNYKVRLSPIWQKFREVLFFLLMKLKLQLFEFGNFIFFPVGLIRILLEEGHNFKLMLLRRILIDKISYHSKKMY